MKERLKVILRKFMYFLNNGERDALALGAILTRQTSLMNSKNINDFEFSIFSQCGDDGIIQYLIQNIEIENKSFIEFGVENYLESNTRFLMMQNNWEGLIIDGSTKSIEFVKKQEWYWKHALLAKAAWITKENINHLLKDANYVNLGILNVDLDGNDYHILEAIDFSKLNPAIIITEYNSVFGNCRKISIPYDVTFFRTQKHFSNLYFGASLPAFNFLLSKRGYALVGSNISGNNAYFVRRDLLNDRVRELNLHEAYKESKFRESRNLEGELSFITGNDRINMLSGLEVVNVETGKLEVL